MPLESVPARRAHLRLFTVPCVLAFALAACGGSSSSSFSPVPPGASSSPGASASGGSGSGSSPSSSPTPTPTSFPANVSLQLDATWQGTLGAEPPTVHMQLYLTNNGSSDIPYVQVEVLSNGQPVDMYNVDGLTNCQLDNNNSAAADLNDLPQGTQELCEPVYKASLLGFSPFHFIVYTNGNTAQPIAKTRDYVCTGTNYNSGETCGPA